MKIDLHFLEIKHKNVYIQDVINNIRNNLKNQKSEIRNQKFLEIKTNSEIIYKNIG